MDVRFSILSFLLISGCSPYLYTSEIDSFATSSQRLTESLNEARQDIIDAPSEAAFWVVYADPTADVNFSEQACDDAAQEPCFLIVNREVFKPTQVEQDLVESIKTVSALGGYVAGLRAVTNAQDREAFDAARAKLAANAGTLLKTSGAAPAAAVTQATVTAGTTLFGLLLDQARFDQLRASVLAVNPYMKDVREPLADALHAIRDHRIDAIKDRMARVTSAFGKRPLAPIERERLMTQLQGDVRSIVALQQARPEDLAANLVAAHDALAQALRTGQYDPVAFLETLNELAAISSEFRTAFSQI